MRTLLAILIALYPLASIHGAPLAAAPHGRAISASDLPPFHGGTKGGSALSPQFVADNWGDKRGVASFFIQNEGQWPGEFAFKYEGGGGLWYITSQGMTIDLRQYEPVGAPHAAPASVIPPCTEGRNGGAAPSFPPKQSSFWGDERGVSYSVRGHVLQAYFVNANPSPEITGEDKLSSYSNYFLGRDSTKWRSRVGHYQRASLLALPFANDAVGFEEYREALLGAAQ